MLFKALASTAEWRVGELKPQELANTAWAFATAGQSDAALYIPLACLLLIVIFFSNIYFSHFL